MSVAENSKAEINELGFYVTMISWGMLFASLFLTYTLFRFRAEVWPPFGFEQIELIWPILSTVAIALSSLTLYLFQKGFEKPGHKNLRLLLFVTTFLAFVFLGLQFKFWSHLKETDFYIGSGIYSSIVHGFTWIHAAHVFLGILGIFFLYPVILKKDLAGQTIKFRSRIKSVSVFWHFLGIIWGLMFLTLFVL
jgi:heme/copper-type cytochrome/quinol oxidase subunit 3